MKLLMFPFYLVKRLIKAVGIFVMVIMFAPIMAIMYLWEEYVEKNK